MRLLAALVSLFMILSGSLCALGENAAATQNVQVKEAKIEIGDNAVRYPQLTGMTDETIQQRINDDIVLSGDITAHILTLGAIGQSPSRLNVSYDSYLDEHIFSVVLSAKGKLSNNQNGQSNVALTYDLSTGERVGLKSLFKDLPAAVSHMEALAEESLSAELSDYLENTALSPLPVDNFMITADGITFYYPTRQFSYLSGYGGACQFYYEEILEFLSTDGFLAQMGVLPKSVAPDDQRRLIETSVKAGKLPHVPVELGQAMAQIVERYRLVRAPDTFPGGRYFVMEAPAFRSVLLISDNMQDGYEHSSLRGIQVKRGGLYGLLIGKSQRTDWQKSLGEPDSSIQFTENMAFDYGLPVGQSDVYRYGDYELRLHSDQEGVLRCVQLGK